ncbi:E3 ubiquitin-protein ligase At4g11680 [Cucumis sativus]|uniref:RING-type E3 ubiquitin transferase n=1 Tax=Cucumis sativus TaxID=3659 RepID=A0A0A0KYD1_CUCSA|nr:E3 ubiquitin-protein ligase At4g11680 [Cucumis sativus]KGN54665.1 hypothetical protein Csa_012005 [Cucumis sativus]
MDDVRPSNSGFLSWQRTMSSRFALPLIQDAANLIMEHRGVIFGDCADPRVDDDEDDNEYERRVLFRNGSSFIKPILVLDLFWNLFFVFLSVIVLVLSAEEKPTAPLRFWLSGYAVQCLFHVFFVFVAYLRRSSRYRLGFENRGAQDELRLSHNRIRVMKRLEALNTMVAYIWWVFGFYWIVMGGQALLEGSPRLYWLAVVFLAFDVFFIIFCTGMAFVGFFAVCCIIPFLAYGYTMNFLEGASEDEIRALPKYRFHQDNPLESFDNDKKQEVGMTLEPGYNGHTTEHTLNAEDSACCICLAQYVHGVQLCMLPCNHHFHTRCIVKWLRINATCPLCKFSIGQGDSLV